MKYTRYLLLLLLGLLLPPLVVAEEIALPLPDGNQGLADFRPGDSDKPAVFILHGFLQTYQFSTVQLIAGELADSGYTVLAPTLTLNIDQRRNSLGCDAIQNHRVADSNREISHWLSWLKGQGYNDIIVIGHSSGSMRLLSYLSSKPSTLPRLFIAAAIGPIHNWRHPDEVDEQLKLARQRVAQRPREIAGYTLGFCNNNYTAPADAYLSYMQWSEQWVLDNLRQAPVAVHVLLGGGDNWLPPDWSRKVVDSGLTHSLIPEASHSFSGPQEFEFLELLVELADATRG